jgi:hypothetical protein
MAPAPTKGRDEAEWAEVLDRIQASLTQSLQQTPDPAPLPPPSDPAVAVRSQCEALDRRMNALQASLTRAEQCAAENDALLRAEVEAMRAWNRALKQVREKLANWGRNAG